MYERTIIFAPRQFIGLDPMIHSFRWFEAFRDSQLDYWRWGHSDSVIVREEWHARSQR